MCPLYPSLEVPKPQVVPTTTTPSPRGGKRAGRRDTGMVGANPMAGTSPATSPPRPDTRGRWKLESKNTQ